MICFQFTHPNPRLSLSTTVSFQHSSRAVSSVKPGKFWMCLQKHTILLRKYNLLHRPLPDASTLALANQTKSRCVEHFANGKFPIFSCTMALGLGQNWSRRVRSVIHMGRGEPSAVSQMIGRCGRDGRPGLAILFVEKSGKNGIKASTSVPGRSSM